MGPFGAVGGEGQSVYLPKAMMHSYQDLLVVFWFAWAMIVTSALRV